MAFISFQIVGHNRSWHAFPLTFPSIRPLLHRILIPIASPSFALGLHKARSSEETLVGQVRLLVEARRAKGKSEL